MQLGLGCASRHIIGFRGDLREAAYVFTEIAQELTGIVTRKMKLGK